MGRSESLKPTPPKVELTGRREYWLKPGLGAQLREVKIYASDSQEPIIAWAQGWTKKTAIRRARRGEIFLPTPTESKKT